MPKHVLFIHGAGAGAYAEDRVLAQSLREALGGAYELHYPQMPDAGAPEYGAWQRRIAQELAALGGPVALVGHSLGASVLLKYLVEAQPAQPTSGLFLTATPFWGAPDWEVDEYRLPESFPARLPDGLPLFLYHCRDDEVVPFAHLGRYAQQLPWATVRAIDRGGHQLNVDLSAVAHDIERLTAGG
ncbi:MAG: alpha/beta fold hydrolase [Chloroflexales bacterium]|nr:alpha/beta fold hydrolase [Chloroflexales bacterium]